MGGLWGVFNKGQPTPQQFDPYMLGQSPIQQQSLKGNARALICLHRAGTVTVRGLTQNVWLFLKHVVPYMVSLQ